MGILSIILIVFVNIKLFKINSSKKKKSKSPDQPRFQGKEKKVHLLIGREELMVTIFEKCLLQAL